MQKSMASSNASTSAIAEENILPLSNCHRWSVVWLLFIASMINYFDRATISFAMPLVKDEFTLRFLFFSKLSPESVIDYLKAQQKKTVLQKESFQRTLVSLRDEIDFFMQAIIRKGIIHLEAENQWLEEVMDDIRSRTAASRSEQAR